MMPRLNTAKDQIVKLRKEHPDMLYREIAHHVGCSLGMVYKICSTLKIGRSVVEKRWADDYWRVRREHPEWTGHQIAKWLGTSSATIYRVQRSREPNRVSPVELGREAARAGLTLEQIRAIADARHA
jgi:hypothetical protein